MLTTRMTWITCALATAVACAGSTPGGGAVDARPHADAPDTPDTAPGTSDAPPGTPDAAAATPDAPASTPDAAMAATDPALPGPYAVHIDDGKSVATPKGNETITIYAPSSDGGATIAPGHFPLVIVSTGYMIGRAAYAPACNHLATWGYVVISHDYASGNHQDHAAGVTAILDWALGASGVASHVDATKIATAGHSMGGKVSILTAILDARVKAVVAWDPVDALPPIADGSYSVTPEKMSGLAVPIALLGETTDGGSGGGGFGSACAPVDDNYHQFFIHACSTPDAVEITIDGADHTQWADPGSCGLACLVCTKGTTAIQAVTDITGRVTVAWLEAHLRGTPGLASWWTTAVGAPTHVDTTACN